MENSALLHMVQPYIDTISDSPCKFRIQQNCLVGFNAIFSGIIVNQPMNTSQISKLLPGFRVHSYYFGKTRSSEAYQEYLFEYRKL